jgi:predicted dehydrogenase
MQFFANAAPVEVRAVPLGRIGKPAGDDDSVVITLRFADGSVGTITYAANGDSAVPKEYFEVFSTGRTAVLDNYRRLTMYGQGAVSEKKRSAIDKGHHEEVQRYVQSVLNRTTIPIPFEESVAATKATFRALDSLKMGKPVKIL